MLDQIENGNIQGLEFIELNACPGGCVGGTMTIENPFIARARLLSLRRYLPITQNQPPLGEKYIPADYFFDSLPQDVPCAKLSDNLATSMMMMSEIEKNTADAPRDRLRSVRGAVLPRFRGGYRPWHRGRPYLPGDEHETGGQQEI